MPLRAAMLVFGAPVYSVALARALSAHCELDLYFNRRHLALRDDSLLEALEDRCTVHLYGGYRHRDPRNFTVARTLCDEIAARGYDVLHLQEYASPWFALAWRRLAHVPLVVTVHDPQQHSGLPWMSRLYQDAMQRHFVRKASRYIVHGEFLRKQLLERYPAITPERVHILPIGELSFFKLWDGGVGECGTSTGDKTILFFGDARPNKGLGVLLRAEAILREKHSGYRVLVAGRCAAHGDYASRLDADARVDIVDQFIPNSGVGDYFRRAYMVVLPYISATQSAILPVAYAYGKPVIATRVGAIPEVLEDGVTGLLTPPKDPAALAEAMARLLGDEDLAARLGAQGQAFAAEHLSWDRIAEDTAGIYRQAAGEGA